MQATGDGGRDSCHPWSSAAQPHDPSQTHGARLCKGNNTVGLALNICPPPQNVKVSVDNAQQQL